MRRRIGPPFPGFAQAVREVRLDDDVPPGLGQQRHIAHHETGPIDCIVGDKQGAALRSGLCHRHQPRLRQPARSIGFGLRVAQKDLRPLRCVGIGHADHVLRSGAEFDAGWSIVERKHRCGQRGPAGMKGRAHPQGQHRLCRFASALPGHRQLKPGPRAAPLGKLLPDPGRVKQAQRRGVEQRAKHFTGLRKAHGYQLRCGAIQVQRRHAFERRQSRRRIDDAQRYESAVVVGVPFDRSRKRRAERQRGTVDCLQGQALRGLHRQQHPIHLGRAGDARLVAAVGRTVGIGARRHHGAHHLHVGRLEKARSWPEAVVGRAVERVRRGFAQCAAGQRAHLVDFHTARGGAQYVAHLFTAAVSRARQMPFEGCGPLLDKGRYPRLHPRMRRGQPGGSL